VTRSDLGGAGLYIPERDRNVGAAAGASAPRRPTGPTMAIVRGTESQTYEVKRKGGN